MNAEAGDKHGRLTIIKIQDRDGTDRKCLCVCECGTEKLFRIGSLRRGTTQSCGCLQRELLSRRVLRHGHARDKTPEYRTWWHMRTRCNNKNRADFKFYGGRGITICERWQRFELFLADMGNKPTSLHTIERINNDAGYMPGNCKWATRAEQSQNKRGNIRVMYENEEVCLSEAARRSSISLNTLSKRINRGWPESRLFTRKL